MTRSGAPTGLLIVGTGRMGALVDAHAGAAGFRVVGRIDRRTADAPDIFERRRWPDAEVAIDFTTPDAAAGNLPRLAAMGIDLVIGTTGWQAHEAVVRRAAEASGIGVVSAANFSPGVALFAHLAAEAGRRFAELPAYGAWLHEQHHAAKRDAPSGTALMLAAAMRASGYPHAIDIACTRAGQIPGTHTVGFDGPAETVTLTHTTRDRATFAHGALAAARWVRGRRGWFGMADVLGLGSLPPSSPHTPHTQGAGA